MPRQKFTARMIYLKKISEPIKSYVKKPGMLQKYIFSSDIPIQLFLARGEIAASIFEEKVHTVVLGGKRMLKKRGD